MDKSKHPAYETSVSIRQSRLLALIKKVTMVVFMILYIDDILFIGNNVKI